MNPVERLNELRRRQAEHESALMAKGDIRAEIVAINAAIGDYQLQIGKMTAHIETLKEKIAEFEKQHDAIFTPPEVSQAEMEAAERMARNGE